MRSYLPMDRKHWIKHSDRPLLRVDFVRKQNGDFGFEQAYFTGVWGESVKFWTI